MNTDRKCQVCGNPLPAETVSRFCCEGCYLTSLHADHTVYDDAYLRFSEALVAALDLREHETGQHSKRVACHTLVLAQQSSNDEAELKQIYWGALLHDLGKIGIPDNILLKQDALTAEEWQIMRQHPHMGYEILSTLPFLQQAAQIVLCHEERFDGNGYPRGLRGEAIPWAARLFAIIDTLDAMTSDRPYRRGTDFDTARDEILSQSGKQFDPAAVDVFMQQQQPLRQMVTHKYFRTPDYLAQHGFHDKSIE